MAKSHDELIAMANLQWSRSLESTQAERAAAAATASEAVTPDVPVRRSIQREARSVILGL